MIARLFLGLQALMLISFGCFCLLTPEQFADSAGLAIETITGQIELRSMYGGLQISVGVFCALAVFAAGLRRAALITLLVIFAGLAPVRIALGVSQGDFSFYTNFAMVFEAVSLAFLIGYLMKTRDTAPASMGQPSV